MIRNTIDLARTPCPTNWGVLCVDCWDVAGSNNRFYQTAVNRLSKFPVTAVVNCTRDMVLTYADKSIFNTLNHYQWHPNSIDLPVRNQVLLNLLESSGHQLTSQYLVNQLFTDTTICLSDINTFKHHAENYFPAVTNWIILGSAWKYCIHQGPMGLNQLTNINNHMFYIFPEWSIQTETGTLITDSDIKHDYFVWSKYHDNGYRLITRADTQLWNNQ